jgi:hypothetical protein
VLPLIERCSTPNWAYARIMGFNRTESAAYLASQLAKGFSRSLQQRAGHGFSSGPFPIRIECGPKMG